MDLREQKGLEMRLKVPGDGPSGTERGETSGAIMDLACRVPGVTVDMPGGDLRLPDR